MGSEICGGAESGGIGVAEYRKNGQTISLIDGTKSTEASSTVVVKR